MKYGISRNLIKQQSHPFCLQFTEIWDAQMSALQSTFITVFIGHSHQFLFFSKTLPYIYGNFHPYIIISVYSVKAGWQTASPRKTLILYPCHNLLCVDNSTLAVTISAGYKFLPKPFAVIIFLVDISSHTLFLQPLFRIHSSLEIKFTWFNSPFIGLIGG